MLSSVGSVPAVCWAFIAAAVSFAPRGRALPHRRAGAVSAPVGRAGDPSGTLPAVPRSRNLRDFRAAVAAVAVTSAVLAAAGSARGIAPGVTAGALAFVTARHLLGRPVRLPPDPGLPLVLDLVAAALRAGRPPADALAAAAPAGRADVAAGLFRVAGLLRLGADPAQAWAVVLADTSLRSLVAVAVRSADSGIKLAAAFERLAADLRAESAARRSVRAHRAGVSAMGPLAACFLPSFVLLGVVPVIVGTAQSALGVLPTGR